MDHCWYVTASWGIHDERWTTALRTQGFDPRVISLERDGLTIGRAREILLEAAENGDASPVLAGPLTTVTTPLVGIQQRLVGLSWGFDLLETSDIPPNLNLLDHIIVDSPASAAVAKTAGVPTDRISQIYWGTDVDVFTPEGPKVDRLSLGVPSEAYLVLSLRAHEDLYRVSDLIDAWPVVMQQHPRAQLVIGNSGSLTEELGTRALELGVGESVHFIGRIPEAELPAVLRSVDLYVSTSPVDGTSVTMLQAMACGCPTLVTDIPGNQHWIQAGTTGYLYSSGDATSLSSAIDSALSSISTAQQCALTEAALESVRDCADWSRNQTLLRAALVPN